MFNIKKRSDFKFLINNICLKFIYAFDRMNDEILKKCF